MLLSAVILFCIVTVALSTPASPFSITGSSIALPPFRKDSSSLASKYGPLRCTLQPPLSRLTNHSDPSLSFIELPDSPFKYPIPQTPLELFVSTEYKLLRTDKDNLMCFLDMTRYNMMKIVTQGAGSPMGSQSYSNGQVKLTVEAESPHVTIYDQAWMIDGNSYSSLIAYQL